MNSTDMDITVEERLSLTEFRGDLAWTLLNAVLLTFMNVGFAMFEAGGVESRHLKSILAKNVLDTGVGTLAWYLIRFGIVHVKTCGTACFAVNDATWFGKAVFEFCFALTCVTITSGSTIGRLKMPVYLLQCFLICAFIYPSCASFVQVDGWLYDAGFNDAAGGMTVHGIAGVFSLVGAYFCGARIGRFVEEEDGVYGGIRVRDGIRDIRPSSPRFMAVGALILFSCWISFNMAASFLGPNFQGSPRAALNSILGACGGAIMGTLLDFWLNGYLDFPTIINCLLGGLVSMTSGAPFYDTYFALLIGMISPSVVLGAKFLVLNKLRIDDSLDVFAVHGAAGIYGSIMLGIFHQKSGLITGNVEFFGIQLGGTLFFATYSLIIAIIYYQVTKTFWPRGILVAEEYQILGLDFKYHDGYRIESMDQDFGTPQIEEFSRRRAALTRLQKARSVDSQATSGSRSAAEPSGISLV